MSGPLHTVHVRVNDAATGKPTPCRVRFTDAEGNYYAPFGRLTNFATDYGQNVGGNLQLQVMRWTSRPEAGEKALVPANIQKWAYIDGTCEIALPAVPITIEITKGPEFKPLKEVVNLAPGKMALRFTLERWVDLRQEGWYSGDIRAHFLTPHGALLEAAAEDLAVVNLLALQAEHGDPSRHLLPYLSNILAFSGQMPALEMPGHMVVVNSWNWSDLLGCLSLLNCHRIVYPLTIGRELERDKWELEKWVLADWCDQCHRKGGLAVWSEFLISPGGWPYACEALADFILGKIDAIEETTLDWCDRQHRWWYGLLNCGFRAPMVASSRKDSNLVALGGVRTYARLRSGEEFSYHNWIEAVREGRVFLTNGPLLSFSVNGQSPGAVIELPTDKPVVHIRAEARSAVPFERLEIVLNGSAVAGTEAISDHCSAEIETNLHVPVGGWLAARCWGEREPPIAKPRGFVTKNAAHSGPVCIRIAGQTPKPDPATIANLTHVLDENRATIERSCRFENERQRDRLLGIFQSAREELLRRAGS